MPRPVTIKKVRADFYVFADDIAIINEVFSMASSGQALQGKQMHLTKTQWVREVLHRAVEQELRPLHNRIVAAGRAKRNNQEHLDPTPEETLQ